MAMFIWGVKFQNHKILLKIDNQDLVIMINNRTSKSKYVMQLLPPFVLLTMRNNIQFRAVHLPGVKNELADSLSRFQMERFRALAPQASQTPADNPVEFLGSNFKREIEYLLYNSVAPSKSKVYKHALEMLNRFRREFSLRDSWPIPLSEIVNFIAYMFKKGFVHSTVNCYISGLSFKNKLHNFEDNTDAFIVRKMLDGIKRCSLSKSDSRLPITRELLGKMLSVLPAICKSSFESCLYKSAFSLCYHGMFRGSELKCSGSMNHAIKVTNVRNCDDVLEIFLQR
jgi:hypothetical protein